MDGAVDHVRAALRELLLERSGERTPELNLAGPLRTVTECPVLVTKRHFTVVPFETVTVGTPRERT